MLKRGPNTTKAQTKGDMLCTKRKKEHMSTTPSVTPRVSHWYTAYDAFHPRYQIIGIDRRVTIGRVSNKVITPEKICKRKSHLTRSGRSYFEKYVTTWASWSNQQRYFPRCKMHRMIEQLDGSRQTKEMPGTIGLNVTGLLATPGLIWPYHHLIQISSVTFQELAPTSRSDLFGRSVLCWD